MCQRLMNLDEHVLGYFIGIFRILDKTEAGIAHLFLMGFNKYSKIDLLAGWLGQI